MLSIKHEPSHSDDIFIHNYFYFQKAGTISLSSPFDKNHLKFSHFLLKKINVQYMIIAANAKTKNIWNYLLILR